MEKLTHVSNLYTTQPAEANEAALKYARVYALRTKGEGHNKFLSFSGAFHGRTFGSLSLTFTEKYQKPYAPLVSGCEVAPYNDVTALARVDRTFAGVLVEPLQGEGRRRGTAQTQSRVCPALCAYGRVRSGCARRASGRPFGATSLRSEIMTPIVRRSVLFAPGSPSG